MVIPVATFQVFVTSCCSVAQAGIPPFPVFHDPGEYKVRAELGAGFSPWFFGNTVLTRKIEYLRAGIQSPCHDGGPLISPSSEQKRYGKIAFTLVTLVDTILLSLFYPLLGLIKGGQSWCGD